MSSIMRLRSIGAQRVLSSNAFPSSIIRSLHSSVLRANAPTPAPATASTPPPPPPKPIPANHFRISIDGRELDVPNNITAIQACEIAGVYIPRFCYHERLSVAGNCRMCLVEVEKVPKPVASCAYPLMPGMKIKTNTPMVKKAREGVMEMLLANHPLDCPICDQGGECDLQDQSLHYGSDKSRFREVKRTVEDKEFGPVVKTVMTRCIHCTRCVRLTTEVCGITDLGTTGRGNSVEIGTYVAKKIDSELSGNVVDVCPVGALTSKPYAFKARPWDLKHTFSVDVLDATGPAIRLDTRGPEVMRILPRLNEEINEEWISDKTRLSYEGLKRQRLDTPLLKKGDQYVPVTWMEALATIAAKVRGYTPSDLLAIAGDLADSEGMIALKDLFNRLGSDNTLHSQSSARLPADLRSNYIFNSTILGLEDADFVLLVGSNPRMESPLVAARLRKIVRNNNVHVASIGPEALLNITHTHLGNNASILKDIAAGKHPLADKLKAAKKPVVIVGMGALQRSDAFSVLATVHSLKNVAPNLVQEGKWNGINILHTQASRVGALDIGFVPGPSVAASKAKFVYLLNADDFDASNIASDAFIVYQGHHGDKGASMANIVLPAAAYTEKSSTYVNIEGRPQRTSAATAKLANARDDWQIIRALSEVIGVPLPYQSVDQVRARLAEVAPHLEQTNRVDPPLVINATALSTGSLQSTPFDQYLSNFYFTNVISRNSRVMSKCSAELPTSRNSYKDAPQQIGAKLQNSMV